MDYRKYIGLPYLNMGRSFSGVDCFGLLYVLYFMERGIILPDYTELKYNKDWYKHENHILDSINSKWTKVEEPYKLWDALIFYLSSPTIANHVGIYIEENKFLHIYEGQTSMISHLNKQWKSKIYAGMRYKRE